MKKIITFNKSISKILPSIDDNSFANIYDKGWGYSYVYHFLELKDVFQALRLFGKYSSLSKFALFCSHLNLPYAQTPWNERRLLEHLNALKNFQLIDNSYNIINQQTFLSNVGKPLYKEDLNVFKKIFFSYIRFCEMHSWFINPNEENLLENINLFSEINLIKNSKPIYTLNMDTRFTDTIFYELKNNATLYRFFKYGTENTIDEAKIRFWDVYIKWASSLKLIEKINLKNMNYSVTNLSKNSTAIYFLSEDYNKFNILDYISKYYKTSYISVVNLILKVALEYRFSISDAKHLIISQCLANPKKLKFQRTSEAFVQGFSENLMPMVNSSYVSHILVL